MHLQVWIRWTLDPPIHLDLSSLSMFNHSLPTARDFLFLPSATASPHPLMSSTIIISTTFKKSESFSLRTHLIYLVALSLYKLLYNNEVIGWFIRPVFNKYLCPTAVWTTKTTGMARKLDLSVHCWLEQPSSVTKKLINFGVNPNMFF